MVSGSQDMTNQHVASLNAEGLKQLFLSGTKFIEANVDAINSLNVFPVPDGDTGINMLLTLQAANDSVATSLPEETVGSLIESLAKGALLGARGNSGVIFSQFIKGMANGLSGCTECHGSNLQSALSHAADAGYLAVGTPVEGTMLSVMKAAATAAKNTKGDLVDVLRNAYESSVVALARTPEQLPILKEAGVVDAGGQGLVAFFAGALTFVGSEQVKFEISAAEGSNSLSPTSINTDFLEHTEDEMYGYCTQFVIHGSEFNPSKIRSEVMHIANSTVVIGDDKLLRVHAHTYNPGELLNLGTQKGNLDQITIQNMDLQYAGFLEKHDKAQRPLTELGIVAVAAGKGISTILKELGAAVVIEGGQAMNPSTAEILSSITEANAKFTIILPNNSNIILAAEQALEMSGGKGFVLPATTIPQGINALLAFNPDQSNEDLLSAMTRSISETKSGEITTAARSAEINGISITEGNFIALVDGKLVSAENSAEKALITMLECSLAQDDSLVTLYFGDYINLEIAQSTARLLSERFPACEFETIEGNQPFYQYFVSIE